MNTTIKSCLTAEQSAALIAKGISADKASEIKEYDDEMSQWTHRGTPIFTLADLFALIPKTIPDDDNKPYGYHRFGIAIDHKML